MDSDLFVHIDTTFGESYISKRSHLLLRLPIAHVGNNFFKIFHLTSYSTNWNSCCMKPGISGKNHRKCWWWIHNYLLGSKVTFLNLLGSMFLAIQFYLSWYLNLLGGPGLGAEIVILTSSNSAVPLCCHVVFDPPGTHKFVKRGWAK